MPEPAERRVLLDENVDRRLRPLLGSGFEVVTVQERGWAGLQNGALLRAAAAEFDVFLTMDRKLPFQQNLSVIDLAVVVVRSASNAFEHTAPLMPKARAAIAAARSGEATVVN